MASQRHLLKLLENVPHPASLEKLDKESIELKRKMDKIVNSEKERVLAALKRLRCVAAPTVTGNLFLVVEEKSANMRDDYRILVLAYLIPAFVSLSKKLRENRELRFKEHKAWISQNVAIRNAIMLHGATPENISAVESIL